MAEMNNNKDNIDPNHKSGSNYVNLCDMLEWTCGRLSKCRRPFELNFLANCSSQSRGKSEQKKYGSICLIFWGYWSSSDSTRFTSLILNVIILVELKSQKQLHSLSASRRKCTEAETLWEISCWCKGKKNAEEVCQAQCFPPKTPALRGWSIRTVSSRTAKLYSKIPSESLPNPE